MGDLCDQADLDRFLRSPEGREELAEIWKTLVGQKVTNVHFTNQVHYVGIGIALEGGEVFECMKPELEVEVIRARFEDVLDREYDKDYPERRES